MEAIRHQPLVAKSLALRWCMLMLCDLGLEDVIIETDAMEPVHATNSFSCPLEVQVNKGL